MKASRGWIKALLLVASLLLSAGPQGAGAAELRLRAECTAAGPLVTLGDVAEVYAADPAEAQRLSAIELFPAPAAPSQRFLRLRELQDLLLLRGVNLLEHKFSGSAQVTICGREGAASDAPESVSLAAARRAERQVCDAIGRYLRTVAPPETNWIVEVTLGDELARAAAVPGSEIQVAGGAPPWTGLQQFDLTVAGPDGPARLTAQAQVRVPASVVVTVRSLNRGAVIGPADVRLQPGEPDADTANCFHTLEEVVGKEVSKSLPAGKPVDAESIRLPLVIRRGDVVTVYARSGGIRVRTTARARDDGSLGDLVAVESLEDRTGYFARATGIREVEVMARSTQAGAASPAATAARPAVTTSGAAAAEATMPPVLRAGGPVAGQRGF